MAPMWAQCCSVYLWCQSHLNHLLSPVRSSCQRKFRNLTSDYTGSCRQVLKHGCWTAEMFYSTDTGHEGFWRVGIARNAVFFHSFVARKVSSEKRGGAEDRLPKMSPKFAPRCGTRAIRKSKSYRCLIFGNFCHHLVRSICYSSF